VRALLATALTLTALLAAREARADAAENDLYDLLMAQQSVSICHFPMSDDTAAKLDDTISAYQKELEKSDADIDQLSEQASWQILRQRQRMCAADGSWKKRYDQIVGDLGG
jgi:esterase/lipase superfamily enzyme